MDALAFLLIYVVLTRYFEPIIILHDLQSKLFVFWLVGDDSESQIDLIFYSLFNKKCNIQFEQFVYSNDEYYAKIISNWIHTTFKFTRTKFEWAINLF